MHNGAAWPQLINHNIIMDVKEITIAELKEIFYKYRFEFIRRVQE
jgi:hypothetical protein